jgi:hypothetical protein
MAVSANNAAAAMTARCSPRMLPSEVSGNPHH